MMVVMESLLSSYFMGHKLHVREVSGLGLAASVVLWIYTLIRLGDLAMRGVLPMAWDGSWQGMLFIFELGVSAVIPATLLLFARVRSRLRGVGVCSAFTVLGMVLYRLDVSIVAFARPEGLGYFPSWEEFAVSVGIVSAFALVFIFFVENLRVYDDVGGGTTLQRQPSFDPGALHGLLPRRLSAVRGHTAAMLAGAVVALLFLPVMGSDAARTPTSAVRVVKAVVGERPGSDGKAYFVAGASGTRRVRRQEQKLLYLIDGNRDGNAVLMDHAGHVEGLGGDRACAVCHHLSMPVDRGMGCYECHRDMYDSTSVFSHVSHETALGGESSCAQCHPAEAAVKSYATATACAECHRDQATAMRVIGAPAETWRGAPSYVDAMHGLCITCHQRELATSPGRHPADIDRCHTCHDADRQHRLQQLRPAPMREKGSTAARDLQSPLGEGNRWSPRQQAPG